MPLTNDQKAVADQFLDFMMDETKNCMVIRGHAGTGKSYVTNELIKMVQKQIKLISILMGESSDSHINVHVTATTNKAARVIGDATGYEPSTIHSLLGIKPQKDYRTGKTFLKKAKNYTVHKNSLIIIDEASFIDKDLLEMINDSTINCKVLFIGDPYQLAPIYETSPPVFELPIETGRLTEVVRNPGPIEVLAGKFREVLQGGEWPDIQANGKEILKVDGPTFQQMVDSEFRSIHGKQVLDPADDNKARILAWSNDRVIQYNEYIRELLGYHDSYAIGERVISNNFMPNHGISVDQHLEITDIGTFTTENGVDGRFITVDNATSFFVPEDKGDIRRTLKYYAKNSNWRDYFHVKENWGDLRPLYASTVHKSQGSTYDTVFIDLDDIGRCRVSSDVARMMYVAVSRAKKRVVFYGDLPDKYTGAD